MKKVLSISLIVILVLSMGLSALGISAADEPAPVVPGITSEAKGANSATAGNQTAPGSQTFDDTWTAIDDEADLNSMTANGKYYLAKSITVNSVHSNTNFQTIDGNGYTITASVPIFNEVKGLTLQNVTIVSTLAHNQDTANGYVSALARWNSHSGAIKLYNVTCNTTISSTKSTAENQYFAGLAMRAGTGSEFINVVTNTNITLDNENISKVNCVAGMIGYAYGARFENCIANGTLTVKQNAVTGCNNNDMGIGGFAGKATGSSTFLNCTSNVVINIEAPADTDSTACKSMGGIAGFSNKGTTFTNCVNNGDITTTATATGWRVGGIGGHFYDGVDIDTCKNTGDITCADVEFAGGILGHSNAATATIKNCENTRNVSNKNDAGGIVAYGSAYQSRRVTITACTNTGTIESTATATNEAAGGIAAYINNNVTIKDCKNTGTVKGHFTVGGIGGYFTNADAVVENCTNGVKDAPTVAAITIGSGDWAAGIVATGDKTQFKKCINYADVTGNGSNRIGGIVGQLNGAPGGFWDCENYGNITDNGGKPVGGLTGEYRNGVTVSGVNKNHGDITSTGGYAGGLFGQAVTSADNNTANDVVLNLTIKDCENHGNISGKEVGGILGFSNYTTGEGTTVSVTVNVTIEDCINEGTITTTHTGGGMVGWINQSNSTIRNCENKGDIVAAQAGTYLGGIAGALDHLVELSDCTNYAEGEIDSSEYKAARVGGLVAQIFGGKGVVKDNENHGNVTTAGAAEDMGGIVGKASAAVFSNNKNEGTITSTEFLNYIGGLAGTVSVSEVEGIENSGIIASNENSGAVISVTAKYVGGIAGYASAKEFNSNTNNVSVTLTGNTYYFGGVVGAVVAANKMNGNVNKGAVSATGAFLGQKIYMGGLAGRISVGSDDSEFKNNENRGTITVTENEDGNDWLHIGGITGYCNSVALYENCKNSGDIKVVSQGHSGMFISGLIGITYKEATYSGCENSGAISVTGRTTDYYGVGGFIGWTNVLQKISDSSNSGDISVSGICYSELNSSNKPAHKILGIGGFVGHSEKGLQFTDSINSGDIVATNGGYTVGGFAGWVGRESSFKNCTNEGDVSALGNQSNNTVRGAGGFLGCMYADYAVEFYNCTNKGTIAQSVTADKNMTGTGGFVGRGTGENDKVDSYGNFKLTFKLCRNEGDVINASLSENGPATPDNKLTNIILSRGGFVGMLNAAAYVEFDNCVNAGDILKGKYDLTDNYTTAGGFVGIHRCLGQGWTEKIQNAYLGFKNCINEGSVEAVEYAGGFLGRTIDIISYKGAKTTTEFTNCLNLGEISSRYAGGIVGLVWGTTPSDTYDVSFVNYNLNGVVNAGVVDGGNVAGGIFARISGATVNVEGCANEGDIKGIYAAGISALTEGYSAVTIKNCFCIGDFDVRNSLTTNPIANGNYSYEGNLYCSAGMKGYDEGNVETLKNIEAAMAPYETFWYYGMSRVNDVIKAAEKIKDASKYSAYTWQRFADALSFAKSVKGKDRFTVTENGDELVVTIVTQADVNRAYNALADAKDGLVLKGAVGDRVTKIMAKANTLINQEKAFLPASWVEFATVYPSVKEYVATVSDFDAVEPTEVMAAMDTLEAAMNALVPGGEIDTAEDFAAIDGKYGTYVLNHNITISKPLDNFAGTIIGNGYTITLDGCGISKVFNGGALHDVKVAGNAGEAASILGKAIGEVEVSAVIVEVEALGAAALIDKADANANISVTYVVSYANASVGALVGNVNCKVALNGVVAQGEAPALMGSVAKGSTVKGSYLAGVEFYGADKKKVDSADILASGKVAYEMNNYLAKLVAEEEFDMAAPTLVQVIGTDAAPYIGAPAVDDSNVVVADYDRNNNIVGYKNPSKTPSVDVEEAPEMPDSIPEAPVYASLNAAIARAEEYVADTYTEESWAALQVALADAKNALTAVDQQSIDNATNALNMAVAGLKAKPEAVAKVDYTKLNETIKKAEALDETDYTDGSWAALSAALAKAKLALDYENQADVDSANTALLRAMTGLVKVSTSTDEQQKPDDDGNDATEPAVDEEAEGCGSVIGGVAVMLTSVIALAGITVKKKED